MKCVKLLSGLIFAASACAADQSQPVSETGQWTQISLADAGLDAASFAALDTALDGEEFPGITSVLVARNGRLIYERYRDADDAGESMQILRDTRSATKTITGMLVGIAMAQGHLGAVDEPIMPLFADLGVPANADPRKSQTSFKDLLTMSSLLECNDQNQYSSGNEERMYVSENWTKFVLNLPIKGFAPWMTKPADSPYGRSFSYCTAGAFLLGAAVEQATGQKLADFSAEHLERPLGIKTVRWNESAEGVGAGVGGTRYRSRDLAKLGELLRLGGRWGERQILPAKWAKDTLTVQLDARENAEYGYLIWHFPYAVGDRTHKVWAMSGNGGNYVFVDPQTDSVAVITSSAYNQSYAHPNSQKLFGEMVLPALLDAEG